MAVAELIKHEGNNNVFIWKSKRRLQFNDTANCPRVSRGYIHDEWSGVGYLWSMKIYP